MLGVVAIIAILGLLILFKMEGTGMGGIYIQPGRAMETISEYRPYSTGAPEAGILASTKERKGRQPYSDVLGYEPCSDGYALERIDAYKPGCVPVNYPRYYIGRQCCPVSTY